MQWVDESDAGYYSGERQDPASRALDRTEKLGKQMDELDARTVKLVQGTAELAVRTVKLAEWSDEFAGHLQTLTEVITQVNARLEALEKTKPGEWEQPNFEKENNEQ